MGLWLQHRCGGQGVAVRGRVVVCVHLWEVLVVAIEQWWWWLSSTGHGCRGLVVIEQWWPLSLSKAVGLAAEQEVVVVFGWLGCALVVVGGMVEVVVAMGWVRGRWLHFHGSCPFVSGH